MALKPEAIFLIGASQSLSSKIVLRNKAMKAHYDRERKALMIDFADGSAGICPVCLLKMVRYDGNDWVPVEATEAQLEAVELAGEHIF